MSDGFNITPDDLDKGGSNLEDFTSKLDASTSKMESAHQGLSSHASSDRSGLGQVIVKFADKTGTAMSGIGKQISRVVKGSATRLKSTAKSHRENEENVTRSFDDIRTKGPDSKLHSASGGSTTTPSSTGPSTTTSKPPRVGGEGGGAPKEPTPSGSGGGGGSGGSGGSGGGGGVPRDGGSGTPDPSAQARPALSGHRPPTATGYSDKFSNRPQLDTPSNYAKPRPNAADSYLPPDKSRGAEIEKLDEGRVTRDENGLISHVDGQPVQDYVGNLSRQRAQDAADPAAAWQRDHPGQPVPGSVKAAGKERTCSAVAIDLKSGLITQGVNGKGQHAIPEDKLHPLLQQNLQDLRAYQHPVLDQGGGLHSPTRIPNPYDGQAHYSVPASHAEVKAVNELLWQRQADGEAVHGPGYQVPPSALQEMRFDPRWTGDVGAAHAGDPAAACANCNTVLHGVPSYTGRCEYDPDDHRYVNPNP